MILQNYRNVVIDTSALIAFFYKEEGWEFAAEYVPQATLSAVNLSEAVKIFMEERKLSKQSAMEYINKAIDNILPFDAEQAALAGELYLMGKEYGLSLGDRACIAAGIYTGSPIITADKIWQKLGLDNVEIILIR